MSTLRAAPDGFLVVLSDVKSENERDYLSWLTTEHVQERLGIPGFMAVRIFRMPIDGGHRYFIWYQLEDADVVDSPAYLARLNNPTPWSRRIMPTLENFGRGGGRVEASVGDQASSMIFATALSESAPDLRGVLDMMIALPEIRAAHLLIADLKKSEVRTNERDLRTNNSSFAALLIVESESEKALNEALAAVSSLPRSPGDTTVSGLYREVFSLTN